MLSSLYRSMFWVVCAYLATPAIHAQVQEVPHVLRVSLYSDYQTRSWSGYGSHLDWDTGWHNTTWSGWSLASTVLTPATGGSFFERSIEWSDDNYNGTYEGCSGWNYSNWENNWYDGPGTPGWLSWLSYYEDCDQPFTEAYDGEEIEPYELPEPPWLMMHWREDYSEAWEDEETSGFGTQDVEGDRHVITSIELKTGGTTVDGNAVGGQSLWMITVSATAKHMGDVPVPASEITVLGKTPDANGRIFILLNDHATSNVTPTFSGAQGNPHYIYEFSVGAERMRLRVADEELWDLTHRTTENWIGAKVALTATLEGREGFEAAGVTVALANVSWTVPASKVFKQYDEDTGTLYETVPINLPTLECYWRDVTAAATVSVSAEAVVNGVTFPLGPAPTLFAVHRPNSEFSGEENGYFGIRSQSALIFGGLTAGTAGMTFEGTVQTVGNWCVVQVVQNSIVTVHAPSGCYVKTDSGLDGGFPYFSSTVFGTRVEALDSPWESLPNNATSLKREDTFKMWLMFQPSGGSWVPVRVIDWGWQATAVRGNNNRWVIGTPSPNSTIIPSQITTAFPVWTRLVKASPLTINIPCP